MRYMRFITIDPQGLAIVREDEIKGLATGPTPETTRIITPHGTYIASGSVAFFEERLQSWLGPVEDLSPGEKT